MQRAFGVFESYFQERICYDIYLELESNQINLCSLCYIFELLMIQAVEIELSYINQGMYFTL